MFELMAHQKKAAEIAATQNLALFHDCGTGKSLSALSIIDYYKQQGKGPALVVCPISIIGPAWMADCKKFTPHLSIVSLWGLTGQKRRDLLAKRYDIYIINFDAFKLSYDVLSNAGFQVIVVDESSKMKNHKSQITDALLSLAGIKRRSSKFKTRNIIPHRYILTGTPAPNDESEYWAQIKFIAGPGDYDHGFYDNFYAFRNRYFSTYNITPTVKGYRFKREQATHFKESMRPWIHVVRKKDVLDLPEQTHNIRAVLLSVAESVAYDQMENDMVAQLENDTIAAKNALTKALSLRELTSGFLYNPDNKDEIFRTGASKLNELKDLLDEIGHEQCIIWYNFEAEKNQILGAVDNILWVDEPGPRRDEVLDAFMQGKLQRLLANPASLGHGVTLTNCMYAVYFSLTASYENMEQSVNRIHRKGQTRPATYYYLIAAGTYDEVIYKTIQSKGNLVNSTLDYFRSKYGIDFQNDTTGGQAPFTQGLDLIGQELTQEAPAGIRNPAPVHGVPAKAGQSPGHQGHRRKPGGLSGYSGMLQRLICGN
ncbi:MAG TPA: DEAD/DEAH box helicase [Anaerohalosphaeraceae bacterium]|nr:DEAD/DEAH box helicase [Anaerohalosphaeraceae bacterium]